MDSQERRQRVAAGDKKLRQLRDSLSAWKKESTAANLPRLCQYNPLPCVTINAARSFTRASESSESRADYVDLLGLLALEADS